MPTITPAKPSVLNDSLPTAELSDIPGVQPFRLRSIVDPATCNLSLHYKFIDSEKEEYEIPLQAIARDISGLIVYECGSLARAGELASQMEHNMLPAIYHYIKGHFHLHRFHDEECDSLLMPLTDHKRPDIADRDTLRKFQRFYLDQYLIKFKNVYTTLSAQYHKLNENVAKKEYKTALDNARKVKAHANSIDGECTYARALLHYSCINCDDPFYQDLNSCTLELQELIRKCSDAYATINNEYNNTLGLRGIYIGVIGIFITLVLEISHTLNTHQESGEKPTCTTQIQLSDTTGRINDRVN